MTKTWSVQEAKANFSELLREAEKEPQIITRHGKVVGVVNGPEAQNQRPALEKEMSALEALRGHFDFSGMPDDDDWLHLDRTGELRPNPFEDDE